MKQAKAIMVLGTVSGAGKSFVTAALCRHFANQGLKVAPFKAQNMSRDSAILDDGSEIANIQVVQAKAAKTEPRVAMNPILLKPTGEKSSQLIVNGKVRGEYEAKTYRTQKKDLWPEVEKAFRELQKDYDVIVVEGAGSPAEINLLENDFVNLGLAKRLGIPAILVGDIERGGVFASVYGTYTILDPEDRAPIKGYVINRFRGDIDILKPGIDKLAEKLDLPCLGVIPHAPIYLTPEDSLDAGKAPEHVVRDRLDLLDIAVIRYPKAAEFSDINQISKHPKARVRLVDRVEDLGEPDLIILPGSTRTIGDLRFLRETGLEQKIYELCEEGTPTLGICGGYQIMGEWLKDPSGQEVEAGSVVQGMNLLPVETIFTDDCLRCDAKATLHVDGIWRKPGFWERLDGAFIDGHEIHCGRTRLLPPSGAEKVHPEPIHISRRIPDGMRDEGQKEFAVDVKEGSVGGYGNALGTYLHGFFKDPGILNRCLQELLKVKFARESKSEEALAEALADFDSGLDYATFEDGELDRAAELVSHALDMEFLEEIMG